MTPSVTYAPRAPVFVVGVRSLRSVDQQSMKRIDIRSIVRQYGRHPDPTRCADAARKIAEKLLSSLPETWMIEGLADFDFYLDRILSGLDQITAEIFPGEEPDQRLDDLNECLTSIYDWADEKSIVLGY